MRKEEEKMMDPQSCNAFYISPEMQMEREAQEKRREFILWLTGFLDSVIGILPTMTGEVPPAWPKIIKEKMNDFFESPECWKKND